MSRLLRPIGHSTALAMCNSFSRTFSSDIRNYAKIFHHRIARFKFLQTTRVISPCTNLKMYCGNPAVDTTNSFCGGQKLILNVEKSYFQNIMENSQKYPDCNFDNIPMGENTVYADRLVTFLKDLAIQTSNSEESKISLPADFTADICERDSFSGDDLIQIYYLLSKCNKMLESNDDLKNLHTFLTHQCKTLSLGVNKNLMLLHILKNCNPYTKDAIYYIRKKLERKFQKLQNEELVEYFYFFLLYQKMPEYGLLFDDEKFLASKIPELSLDEVALIAQAFFRCRCAPGSMLSLSVAQRFLDDLPQMNNVQSGAFSKFLQLSSRSVIRSKLQELFNMVSPYLSNFSITSAIHIICAGINVNVGSSKLVMDNIQRLKGDNENVRLKDIERLLLATVFFNVDITEEPEFLDLISGLKDKRKNEVDKYPRAYLSIMNYLVVHNIFCEDSLNFLFSEDFIQNMHRRIKHITFREFLFIDLSIELEKPDYGGNRLNLRLRKKISKMTKFLPVSPSVESSSFIIGSEIMKELCERFGSENCTDLQLMPHYASRHQVVCLNRNGDPQEIGNKLTASAATVIRAPDDGNLWICFVQLRPQGCLEDQATPNFFTKAKLRQLKVAGYTPVLVHSHPWRGKTSEEKSEFIGDIIEKSLMNADSGY